MPLLNALNNAFCDTSSLDLTKKLPTIEAITPIEAITIGIAAPFTDKPAATANAQDDKIEPTYDS